MASRIYIESYYLFRTATEKNSRKLLENFFYFKFDAVKDWSLEVSNNQIEGQLIVKVS